MTGPKRYLTLSVVSGIFLGVAFPPSPTGLTAFVAFVPFLILSREIDGYGRLFRYSYLMLFIFHLLTLYWAGGFVHGRDLYMMSAGTLLLVGHPLIYSIPLLLWNFIRKKLGFNIALFSFPFVWTAFEYVHSISQLSFPWIIIGNTQTHDLALIQFASVTGVYGISFLLLSVNVVVFLLWKNIVDQKGKVFTGQTVACAILIVLLFVLPKIYGLRALINYQKPTTNDHVRIAVVQPNIDPFEKWQESVNSQLEILKTLTVSVRDSNVDLVLWPETAIPFYILNAKYLSYQHALRKFVDTLGLRLLTGAPDITYYLPGEEVPVGAKGAGDLRYDNYNASMLFQFDKTEIQKYAKINLVPFAEHVPYSEYLSFLNAAQWNFGLGGWSIGKDSTVFQFTTQAGTEACFSNFICYESVFPGFVASFVNKGAQFITIITNDSWWGNTSGAYQHQRYAVLRAVENRRWVIQCANGGISCFVDPMGNVYDETKLYSQSVLVKDIYLNNELTFYAKHGDWFAEICLIVTTCVVFTVLGLSLFPKMKLVP